MTSVFAESTLHRLGLVRNDNTQLLDDIERVRKNVETGETTSVLIIEFHPGQLFTETMGGDLGIAEVLGMLEMIKWRAMMRKHHAES